MDLSKLYPDLEQTKSALVDLPIRLIAPLPNVVPEDGDVSFVTVESLSDVLAAPKHSVLLFSENNYELLDVVVQHPQVVGFASSVLSGLPSADYNSQFESKTYQLERISYPSLVNDLVESKRVRAALADETATPYDKERSQYTRKGGHVKELTGTTLAGKPDDQEQDFSLD